MQERNSWYSYEEDIDKILDTDTCIHIDTRDFGFWAKEKELDLQNTLSYRLLNKPELFLYKDLSEVKSVIEDLYKRSGGKGEWRMLSFKGVGREVSAGWQCKYLTFYKLENGWVLTIRLYDEKILPLTKEDVKSEIEEKYLAHQ